MDILDIYCNRQKMLEQELKDFVDEYDGKNGEMINALADKINHMCNNIGCPSSVKPMLLSICERKIKKWAKGDDRGKQLHGFPTWYIDRHYQIKNNREPEKNGKHDIDVGHFRWNWKSYMIDRDDAEYIFHFFFDKEIIKQKAKKLKLTTHE